MADTIKTLSVRFNLNNGLDSEGNVKTISISAGSTISPTNYINNEGDTKVLNIADALGNCLSKELVSTQKSITAILSRS